VLTAEDVPLQEGSNPQGLEAGQETQDETAKITTVEKVEEGAGTAVGLSDPDARQLQHARPIAQDDADQNADADRAPRTHRSQLHTPTLPLLPQTQASPKQAQRQRQDNPGPKELSQTNQMIPHFYPYNHLSNMIGGDTSQRRTGSLFVKKYHIVIDQNYLIFIVIIIGI
jgi:hypothetical protein